MQPKLEKIPSLHSSSIAVKREVTPYMDYPWHYHPEFEIIYVEKSYGIRFMGNHIGNFTDGDLMFISSNLPHVWKNDQEFYKGNKDLSVDVYVIHFNKDALKDGFFDLPEFAQVKKLFLLGEQGFSVRAGKDHQEISALIKQTVTSSGIDRLVSFIRTLEAFANAKDYDLLSSPGYITTFNLADAERINIVMNYVMEQYTEEINIKKVASLINLTEASFCRYFKYKTHKTFSQFLNEVRILNACKLLVNSNMTITQICYKTGYNNISHFNRQFKSITGLTANQYKKKYKNETF